VDSAIGHAVTNPEYNEFLKKESLGEKLKEVLADVANLVTTAGGIAAIASEIAKRISN
jgi:NTP pyrophosphatase (non-canonical NTP hydrolase)